MNNEEALNQLKAALEALPPWRRTFEAIRILAESGKPALPDPIITDEARQRARNSIRDSLNEAIRQIKRG